MPSAWSLLDSSFPTFSGDERVRDQMGIVLNYMFMLTEGLKYQLSNLGAQNFNTTALKTIQIETTADVEAALDELVKDLVLVKNSVSSLRGDVSSLGEWQKTAAKQLSDLSKAQEDLASAQEDQLFRIEEIQGFVSKNEEGIPTIGTAEGTLNLIGKIYINGTLIE